MKPGFAPCVQLGEGKLIALPHTPIQLFVARLHQDFALYCVSGTKSSRPPAFFWRVWGGWKVKGRFRGQGGYGLAFVRDACGLERPATGWDYRGFRYRSKNASIRCSARSASAPLKP